MQDTPLSSFPSVCKLRIKPNQFVFFGKKHCSPPRSIMAAANSGAEGFIHWWALNNLNVSFQEVLSELYR